MAVVIYSIDPTATPDPAVRPAAAATAARADALPASALPHALALGLTALAMLAFAANSLLCRAALKTTGIDPASFTAVRILSGAAVLALLVVWRAKGGRAGALRSQEDGRAGALRSQEDGRAGALRSQPAGSRWLPLHRSASEDTRSQEGGASEDTRAQHGDWPSALALFAYAAAFSFAYTSLTAATGALLLFGAVQATMLGYAVARGERLSGLRLAGSLLAGLGLVALLLPGLAAPPLGGALLMLGAGAAWGVYSLRGKGAADPVAATAGNFVRAAAFALALGLAAGALRLAGGGRALWPAAGLAYAALSGAVTSGLGYAVWYAALRGLHASEAAVVQLSVPVLAAGGGVLLLGEAFSLRLGLCALAILGGIALVVVKLQGS
jgi:drug/metabolite transporter (DMT)-like permease